MITTKRIELHSFNEELLTSYSNAFIVFIGIINTTEEKTFLLDTKENRKEEVTCGGFFSGLTEAEFASVVANHNFSSSLEILQRKIIKDRCRNILADYDYISRRHYENIQTETEDDLTHEQFIQFLNWRKQVRRYHVTCTDPSNPSIPEKPFTP